VDSLDDLCAMSNVLSIHCVLNKDTRGLVGARQLALLPQGAFLINVSRGPIVDEEALVRPCSKRVP
jgi:D-3-phosphoglycerate dehydrogenase